MRRTIKAENARMLKALEEDIIVDETIEASEIEVGIEDLISDSSEGTVPTVQEIVETDTAVDETAEVFPTESNYVAFKKRMAKKAKFAKLQKANKLKKAKKLKKANHPLKSLIAQITKIADELENEEKEVVANINPMKAIIASIDELASELEQNGNVDVATELDVISNTLEQGE